MAKSVRPFDLKLQKKIYDLSIRVAKEHEDDAIGPIFEDQAARIKNEIAEHRASRKRNTTKNRKKKA